MHNMYIVTIFSHCTISYLLKHLMVNNIDAAMIAQFVRPAARLLWYFLKFYDPFI
jgi:hypothetical protein